MTVAELIERLRACNQNAEVAVCDVTEGGVTTSFDVREGGVLPTPNHSSEGVFRGTGDIPPDPGWRSCVLLEWNPS